jgi:hypothetical protein
MANDTKTSQPTTGDHMGISFNEIHSDEPHEAVTASKTEVSQKHTSTPPSHLSNKDDVFNVSRAFESGHIESGTIVSDKKGSRPSFGENVLSALGEWWGKTKGTIDNSAVVMQTPIVIKKPEPLVSKVETRVDVVKTAATHATLAPKDDHKMVIQKIRTFKQDVARVQNAGIVVKEESKRKGSWTHTEEKPIEVAKKIELETLSASVAVEQKMIPDSPPVVPRKPSVPTPPRPSSSSPQSVPKEAPNPVRMNVEVKVPIAPSRPAEVVTKSTPHMTVPDTVVKKDAPVPKKNIWVAPRIQPESSVLMPHRAPTPVSQSYIPNQSPVPPKASAPLVSMTEVSKPSPVSLLTPNHDSASHTHQPTGTVSTPPLISHVSTPFHTSSTQPVPTVPNVPDVKSTAEIPAPHPQNTPSTSDAPAPALSKKTETPVAHHVEGVTVLKEISNIPPVNTSVPKAPEPQHTILHHEHSPETTPAPMHQATQRHAPPHIVRPALYTHSHTESSRAQSPEGISAKEPTLVPTAVPHTFPVPRPPAVSKPVTEETTTTPVIQIPEPHITPAKAPTQPEVPRAVSVPLPRPILKEVPQPVFEAAPVTAPVENSNREIPQPVTNQFVPRTAPSPLPSRPIALPPLERVVSTPIPAHSPEPTNKRFRAFVKWAILVCIVLLGIALALFASFYFNVFKKETPSEQPTIAVPTFLATTAQTPLMIEGTKEVFLTMLTEKVRTAEAGLIQFYPTIEIGETKRIGTSEEILTFLNTHLDQRTLRSLNKTLMIGSITTEKNEPFIVLQSSNFDVLFTGLLAWEPHISADFAPLFGEQTLTNIKFKDAVRDNTSTRILYDESGKEILLYSFINQNTVVITTSGEALSKLIAEF